MDKLYIYYDNNYTCMHILLNKQIVLAQFVKCLCSFSYKCKHYQNSVEATVMAQYLGLVCMPAWFDFTTLLAWFIHVV